MQKCWKYCFQLQKQLECSYLILCVHVVLYAAFSWYIIGIFFQQVIATSTQKLMNMYEKNSGIICNKTGQWDDLLPMKRNRLEIWRKLTSEEGLLCNHCHWLWRMISWVSWGAKILFQANYKIPEAVSFFF